MELYYVIAHAKKGRPANCVLEQIPASVLAGRAIPSAWTVIRNRSNQADGQDGAAILPCDPQQPCICLRLIPSTGMYLGLGSHDFMVYMQNVP